MSSNDSGGFLKRLSENMGYWATIISATVTILGAFQALSGNWGTHLPILLIAGIIMLWIVSLYYARFWHPEQGDGKTQAPPPSSFISREEQEQYKADQERKIKRQNQKVKRRAQIRWAAKLGSVSLPLILAAGGWGWHHVQNLPSQQTVVLVSEFQNQATEKDDKGVTDTIWSNLEFAVGADPHIKLIRWDTPLKKKEAAIAAGKAQKAAIVIRGWYNRLENQVPISTNVELLKQFEEQNPFELTEDGQGAVQTVACHRLDTNALQTELSQEMSYFTLFVVGMTQYSMQNWDSAVNYFNQALDQIDETNREIEVLERKVVYNFRGRAHFEAEKYAQAVEDYSQAIAVDSQYADAYYNRGRAYRQLEKYQQAIKDFNTAIKLNPEDAAYAYSQLGWTYREQGEYEEAIRQFTEAIKRNNKIPCAYHGRGWTYHDQENYKAAIEDYTQVIALNAKFVDAFNNRGNVYLEQEEYGKALEDYEQAIQLDPQYARPYVNRGDTYSALGDYEQALANYKQAIQLDPKFTYGYVRRAAFYEDQKQYDLAIEDYTQAIQQKPEWINLYSARAAMYELQKQYDLAIEDYTQAIQQDPEWTDLYLWRAEAYLKQSNQEKAVADLQQVLRLTQDSRAQEDLDSRQQAEEQLKDLNAISSAKKT